MSSCADMTSYSQSLILCSGADLKMTPSAEEVVIP